jgi:excisionase family DNA binding protein
MENFLKLNEVADILKVSKMTVYRYIKAGKLSTYKFGKEYRVTKADFDEFLSKNKISL